MRIRQSLPALSQHPQFGRAELILKELNRQGYQTVFAGGCVRDSLLGLVPKDLDIATAAPPETVERSFQRTTAVGKAFGTIVVVEGGHNFEVTTFRKEGPYLDGRHPSEVKFTDIEEDSRRRDFTVNALYFDPEPEEVLDFVDGRADLERKVLRTVGSSQERFEEDRLRMLRAPRFVAQLGFRLDPDTLRAIQEQHSAISKVSAERIFAEMRRLLSSHYLYEGLKVLVETQLHKAVWPELEKVGIAKIRDFEPLLSWENSFSALTLLAGVTNSEERLRAWKAPLDSIKRVAAQIAGCKILMNPSSSRSDRAQILGAKEFAETLALAHGFLPGNESVIQRWISEYLEVTGTTATLPPPLVTGKDLLAAGIAPGATMGHLLKALYADQLEGKIQSREEALRRLKLN